MVEGPSGRAGNGRETLRQSRNWSGLPSAGPKVVGGPFGNAGSGRGALQLGRKRSGYPLKGPNVVGGSSGRAGNSLGGHPAVSKVVWRLFGRARSGGKALWQGRKLSGSLRQYCKLSGCPSAGLEVVKKPSGIAGSGQEALRQGRKSSGGPPVVPEEVGIPSGRVDSGRGAFW